MLAPHPRRERAMGTVHHQSYSIRTYEREPGRWLAETRRLDGKDITILIPPGGSRPFVMISHATYSEQAAINEAKAAIDGGGMR
jgi:hypothetical protein